MEDFLIETEFYTEQQVQQNNNYYNSFLVKSFFKTSKLV